MDAKLVMCNVPTTDFDASLKFYGSLLGIDPGEFLQNNASPIRQYYEPISADGVDLTISEKNDSRDTTVMYFAVPSVSETVTKLQDAGGKEIYRAERLGKEPGQMSLMVDPDGNYVGLLELSDQPAQYFRVGEFRELNDALYKRLEEARAGAASSS